MIPTPRPELTKRTSWLWYAMMGLYILYAAQGLFYTSGGLLSQFVLLAILGAGGVCMGLTLMAERRFPKFLYWVLAFWIMLSITFVISPKQVYAEVFHRYLDTFQQYKVSTVFCLTTFVGYYIGRRQRIPVQQWLVLTGLVLLWAIVAFFKTKMEKVGVANANETNNSGYAFIYVLPFAAMLMGRYRKIALVFVAIAFAFVMAGAKRGAILCFALLLVYGVWWYYRNFKFTGWMILGIVAILAAGGWYAKKQIDTNKYLQKRLEQTEQGNTSGREDLYAKLWSEWQNSKDGISVFIGKGSAQSVTIAGNYAHNDWLELLIDNGLLGVAIYFMMFFTAFKYIFKTHPNKYVQLSMMLILLFWLIKTFYSMGYASMAAGLSMMLLGMQMGNIRQYQEWQWRMKRWRLINSRRKDYGIGHPSERNIPDEEDMNDPIED